MNKFKKGQRVKCVEGYLTPNLQLIKGNYYKILRVNHKYQTIVLEGMSNQSWNFERFTLSPVGYATILKMRNGKYRSRLFGLNGEPVMLGQPYSTRQKCVQTLKRLFPDFEIKKPA